MCMCGKSRAVREIVVTCKISESKIYKAEYDNHFLYYFSVWS